ncbi:hypothetical protein AC578_10175 [Pseudocercospora eumusae]|uniref:SnoaL-like domain-containing protein n=1 Tax=Pseudocercospora eumusae TaxID=321146 RepID=A0A139HZ57_9PEZI|nr:hypothetical protein AC578_10175 [Pseudocercospora eumusae]
MDHRPGDDHQERESPEHQATSSANMGRSFDLLNPKPWASRRHTYTSETAKQLEALTEQLLVGASNQDWRNPIFRHMDPGFTAEFEHAGGRVLDSWQVFVDYHTKVVEANPGYRFEVLNTNADVYESNGSAVIWALLRVFDHPKDVVRESIVLMQWRRKHNEWKCYKQRVIRGMDWNT